MTHPTKGPFANSRMYRTVPFRETVRAETQREELLATVHDCNWRGVTYSESGGVMELQATGRVWNLPILLCASVEYIPQTKQLLRTSDSSIWEIHSVSRSDDGLFWSCVTNRLRMHRSGV